MADLLQEYAEELKEADLPPLKCASNVLNICRSWHAALSGNILSKSEAAAVALRLLPKDWNFLIQSAVEVRSGLESPENAAILKEKTKYFAELLAEVVRNSTD